MTIKNFFSANKVLLAGLLMAAALVYQQYTATPPVDYKVVGFAVLLAAIGFLANNLHGEFATICGSLLPTVGILKTAAENHQAISWDQILISAAIAVLGVFAGPAKAATKTLIVLVLILGSLCGNAQSLFKPIPKPVAKPRAYAMSLFTPATTPLPDSTFRGFRLTASAVYGYTVATGSTLLAGTGVSYEHDTYSAATQKWYTDWAIQLEGYAGGSQAPTNLGMVTAVGLSVAFFNKILVVGVAYNISAKNAMPIVGPGVSLNN